MVVGGMVLKAKCPKCGAELELWIDDSSGPPDEIGTECDCGAIPVWGLDWGYSYKLGEYKYDETRYVQICGHPFSSIVSSDEGTHYCRECEEEK